MISISRTINGISINGDEFFLDSNGEVMLFESVKEAKLFLSEHGEGRNIELDVFNFYDETIVKRLINPYKRKE